MPLFSFNTLRKIWALAKSLTSKQRANFGGREERHLTSLDTDAFCSKKAMV